MTQNQKDIMDILHTYEPSGSEYIEEHCWDWAVERAEKTIMAVKDTMDNNEGNRLTEDFFNELFEKLCVDYYFDVYTPEEIYE